MSRPALVPELCVSDISASLRFYVELLGFIVEYQRPEDKFAAISLEGAHLMLEQTASFRAVSDQEFVENREWRTGVLEYPFGRGINFEITVSDVQLIYSNLVDSHYPIKVPLETRWYRVNDGHQGVMQFLVLDPDGYLLRISQSLGWKQGTDATSFR